MKDFDWRDLRVLNQTSGSWGDATKLNRSVVTELDRFAFDHNYRIVITCGTQGEHVDKSYHYQGLAIDFMIPDLRPRNLPDVFINLLRYDFTGVGVYSEWRLNAQMANTKRGGFHVDMRPQGTKALWLKGTGGYESVTMDNLRKYFV